MIGADVILALFPALDRFAIISNIIFILVRRSSQFCVSQSLEPACQYIEDLMHTQIPDLI